MNRVSSMFGEAVVSLATVREPSRIITRPGAAVAVTSEEFVDLPLAREEPSTEVCGLESAALTLTRQGRDGRRLSIQGELSLAQWRWALGLLQEAGR